MIEHRIHLKPRQDLIRQRYLTYNPAMQNIDTEIDNMLRDGRIEPTSSPWNSSIVLAKKDRKYRFCIDFCKINEITEKNAYPLPQHILDQLREARFLSTIDLKNGYWQVPLYRPLTFAIPGREQLQFKVMPFGLHAAPATFQKLLDRVGPDMEPRAFAYLDDIVVLGGRLKNTYRI